MIEHDELFKQLLSTFFIEFLELFLPQVANSIDQDSVRFLPQEYFADLTVGEKKIIDLLAEVRCAGQETGFLIHLENQASSEANFTRRMFFYNLSPDCTKNISSASTPSSCSPSTSHTGKSPIVTL